ncbi:MAG TPA: TIGR03790 family protein [Tepidisphaeraceae bacterium]|jgi:uncharacterized protein (TIGR03790 family)|nr:TIGR03790 family protein [Tepidisphaeraceae bacterium]
MARHRISVLFVICAAILAGVCSTNAFALEPDQIALVVNSNVPAGRKLADFYAAARHIPAGRIIELSLSASKDPAHPLEDITPEEYDAKVLPGVRDFLTKHDLKTQVTCLVTFWGVPLRIDGRSLDASQKKEVAELKSELDDLRLHVETQVKAAESLAVLIDPDYHPGTVNDLDGLGKRAETSLNSILTSIVKMPDTPRRVTAYDQLIDLIRDLAGIPAATEKKAQPQLAALANNPPTAADILAARQHVEEVLKQINALQSQPQTIETRGKIRDLFRANLGSLNLARLIIAQIRETDTAESESAFDSELALLWWPSYPKSKWTLNPLDWHYAGHIQLPAHTLMVTRLDGPTEQSVHDLIATSIKVENEGLKGEVVLDARGKAPSEPYGVYDQTIRNLNTLLEKKTTLKVVLDNEEPLIPENSEKDIAIYCGWYSLRHYVSPGKFNPGAVAFHVASSEMVSLHNPGETGWCQNLMKAGVVATLGPVAEPYLQSFPPADEFFPLLMTGKLTLAEVYWKTSPWASWMQCCVGDPLYRPYKVNPPLKVEDLPEALKGQIPQ